MDQAQPPSEAFGTHSGAVCAIHADAPAVVTCERCGDFCGDCCVVTIRRSAYCRACAARVPRLAGMVPRVAAGYLDVWLVIGTLGTALVPFRGISIGAAIAVATNIVLLTTRAQTIGMLLFGLRFVTPDGGPVGTLRLLVTRFVVPMAAMLVASRFPVGIGLAGALNFGCMRPNEGLTLIDTLTQSVVTARGWQRGEDSASDR